MSLKLVEFGFYFDARFFVHAIDEEDALKMIVFVLDGAGQQSSATELKGFAFFIGGFYIDAFGPGRSRRKSQENSGSLLNP